MDFIHRPKSKILKIKITTFRKLTLLPSSGEWRRRRGEHLLSWAPQTDLASITDVMGISSIHLRTEAEPASEMSRF
jgi:hypothetical protein